MGTDLRSHAACGECGKPVKRLFLFKSMRRVYTFHCEGCGEKLVSDLGWSWYIVLIFYTQIIVLILVLPIIFGIFSGTLSLVVSAAFVFFVLVMLPAALLHNRRVRVAAK